MLQDYVILDEGHKIKNPTKTTKAVYDIPAKNRLVLTGTPIQNNLRVNIQTYTFKKSYLVSGNKLSCVKLLIIVNFNVTQKKFIERH